MPLANLTGKQEYVSVIKTEEKGSDVNLASHLINDGYQGRYEGSIDRLKAGSMRSIRYA